MPTTDELQAQIDALTQRVDAITAPPTDYYMHQYSGEEIDEAVGDMLSGTFIIPSSTAGSSKKFRVSVDDAGTVTAMEVTTT